MTNSIFDYMTFGRDNKIHLPYSSGRRSAFGKYEEILRRTEEKKKQRRRARNKKANLSRKKNRGR